MQAGALQFTQQLKSVWGHRPVKRPPTSRRHFLENTRAHHCYVGLVAIAERKGENFAKISRVLRCSRWPGRPDEINAIRKLFLKKSMSRVGWRKEL